MRISDHFMFSEFACRCGCGGGDLDGLRSLCGALEVVRSEAGDKPITITSGYRCRRYNTRVKGAKASRHTQSIAADFRVSGMEPAEVLALCERLISEGATPEGGLAAGSTFVHYDLRGQRARWTY